MQLALLNNAAPHLEQLPCCVHNAGSIRGDAGQPGSPAEAGGAVAVGATRGAVEGVGSCLGHVLCAAAGGHHERI